MFGKSRRVPIPRVPTDKVVATTVLENNSTTRSIVMGYCFGFNQILDCDKLHAALCRLLEIGEWRRLGGRLRLDAKGRMEIHIPEKFTAERPAVFYSTVSYPDIKIDEHPVASRLPRPSPSGEPSILSGHDDYMGICEPDQTLHSFDDYIYSDRPQLSLHCVTFRDATVVTLKLPHGITDVMGFHALAKNWSRVLADREDLVQPLTDFSKDPVAQVAELDTSSNGTPSSDFTIAGTRPLAGLGLVVFILRFVFILVFGDKTVTKMLYLPARTVEKLKNQARKDIEADPPTINTEDLPPGHDPLFVSVGDVLNAWLSHLTISASHSSSSTQTVSILNIFDMRGRIPQVFGERSNNNNNSKGPVWVQNLTMPLITHVPVKTLLSQSLGKTALEIRAAVREQATVEAISKCCAYMYPIAKKGGMSPVVLKWDSIIIGATNWLAARLFETVDFGPAVLEDFTSSPAHSHPGGMPWTEGGGKPGRPVSICPVGFSNNPELRNAWVIVGRDAGGNFWLQGTVTQGAWDVIGGELARFGDMEDE